MNLSETSALLALIASVDNRRVEDATVLAWHDILGHLGYRECQAAVRQHFAGSTAYLMPAHIRELVVIARNNQPRRSELLEVGGAPRKPAEAEHVKRCLAQIAETLSMTRINRKRTDQPDGPVSPSDAIRERALERARAERRGAA